MIETPFSLAEVAGSVIDGVDTAHKAVCLVLRGDAAEE